MEINIKDKLRALRQQKNVTQEALANHLGITPQSVGKWERGEGFPDITLLPNIAIYFGVTVDELLSVDNARIEEKIKAYEAESLKYRNLGETDKNLELWEKAYKEFPNDCRVMRGLMHALFSDGGNPKYEEGGGPDVKEYENRIYELGEAILAKTTDKELREDAIQLLCFTYEGNDDEKALMYADMAGDFWINRDNLRCQVLKDEEGVKECQTYLADLVLEAALTAASIPWKKRLTYEEMIEAYSFARDILLRLYKDGNIGFYAPQVSRYCKNLAHLYAELSDAENTIKCIEDCCKYAIADPIPSDKDYEFTAPLVNRVKYDCRETTRNCTGNSSFYCLQALENKKFDFVRNDKRFKKAISEMKKHEIKPTKE